MLSPEFCLVISRIKNIEDFIFHKFGVRIAKFRGRVTFVSPSQLYHCSKNRALTLIGCDN